MNKLTEIVTQLIFELDSPKKAKEKLGILDKTMRALEKEVSRLIMAGQVSVLEKIADGQGWEESRNHYARKLGLPEIEFKDEQERSE